MSRTAKLPVKIEPVVQVSKGQALTSSLDVAASFDKTHRDVLRAIKKLDCSDEFRLRNFAQTSYQDSQGKTQPMVVMTKDGFSFLTFGFTGEKAGEFKEAYINKFNEMEKAIYRQQNTDWQQLRLDGKAQRKELTDAVQQYIAYATAQGSTSAKFYYTNITKMTYKCLSLLQTGGKVPQNFRDLLDKNEVAALRMAELVAEGAILDGIDAGTPYKEIYELAKAAVDSYAKTVLPRLTRTKPRLALVTS